MATRKEPQKNLKRWGMHGPRVHGFPIELHSWEQVVSGFGCEGGVHRSMSPGGIYGEQRKGWEWEWDGPCQGGKQRTEWKIKAGSLGRDERKRRSGLPLSSFHTWTLSAVPQPLISPACLIAASDTWIDPSWRASWLPSLPQVCPSLFLLLPSPSFVDIDVPCLGGCFQKSIFLITCLLG